MKKKSTSIAELRTRLTNESKTRIKSLRERIAFTCDLIDSTVESTPVKLRKSENFLMKINGMVQIIQELEFALQKEWGFPQDANYHTYWSRPKSCTCPKMDNADYFGFGKIITSDCPLHGHGFEFEKIKNKPSDKKADNKNIIDFLTQMFGE